MRRQELFTKKIIVYIPVESSLMTDCLEIIFWLLDLLRIKVASYTPVHVVYMILAEYFIIS